MPKKLPTTGLKPWNHHPITAAAGLAMILQRGELVSTRRQVFLVTPLTLDEMDLLIAATAADEDAEQDDPSGTELDPPVTWNGRA